MNSRTSQFPVPAQTPEVHAAPDDPTTQLPAGRRRAPGPLARLGLPGRGRRPVFLLAAAATGALVVNVLGGPQPAADAETATVPASVGVARQLGLDPAAATDAAARVTPEDLGALGGLTASRAQREAEAATAVQAQAAADQAELDRRAAEKAAAEKAAAEKAAAEQAAAEKAAAEKAAAEKAAAERAAAAPAPRSSSPASSGGSPAPSGGSPAPAGSFKDYALAKVGSAAQFGCLEALWGKESGWNPNAQNPRSTAYGIPQFLDSTWAGTGIPKTADGYRQIDAGLIYIQKRYGSPCGAWSHSQATGWY